MVQELTLQLPQDLDKVKGLRVGDIIYLSGEVYTLRDRAHQRLAQYDKSKGDIPFNLEGKAVWHCGPAVKEVFGQWEVTSVGPTTSYRFSGETPFILERLGVKVIIGKGGMDRRAIDSLIKEGAVFLSAMGGCAAFYAQRVQRVIQVYWTDLGLPEAVWQLEVKDFGALVVSIDSTGENLYQQTKEKAGINLHKIYHQLNLDANKSYIYWPPYLAGTPQVIKHFEKGK